MNAIMSEFTVLKTYISNVVHMDFWNNLHQVRSMSTDWKAKENVFGAGRPMGIHRIAKSSNVTNA